MKNLFSMKTISLAAVASIALLVSCSKTTENPLNSTDSQNVNSEAVAASSTDESADMTSSVVAGVSDSKLNSGSRIAGKIAGNLFDPRLAGATITITPSPNSTIDNPSGTITIDFGTGQTVNGVTRKGIISIAYMGKRWTEGSYRTITYSDYYRNDVKVGGSYKVTNVSQDSSSTFIFHHQLTDGLLSFPDQTTVSRNADYNVVWDFVKGTVSIENSGGTSSGTTATGTTRKGKDYTMTIVTSLVYKAECLASKVNIPVSGEKKITTGNITYDINYGDGGCDNTVTVTIAGKKVTITSTSNGN